MLVEEPDVRKALVRFREGWGGNLRGAPLLLDLRLVSRQLAAAQQEPGIPFGDTRSKCECFHTGTGFSVTVH